MFIVWGKKPVYRKIGYAADFCPICRKIRPFRVTRIGIASHVYYVTSGEGELAGYTRTCQKCNIELNCDPHIYASMSKRLAPLEELVVQTLPNYREVYGPTLAQESIIRKNPYSLPNPERYSLIRHPFLLISPKVEKWSATSRMDILSTLALLASFFVVFPGVIAALSPMVGIEASILTALVFAALLTGWQMVAARKRFMKREVFPILARALSPLKPSKEELVSILAELKQLKHKVGGKLKPDELIPYLGSS